MIAQLILTVLLTIIILVAFVQLPQIPVVGAAVIASALFGAYLIWSPEQATFMAQFFGIGRGADLVLYVWVLISFATLLLLYLNSRQHLQALTVLARSIALAEACDQEKEARLSRTESA